MSILNKIAATALVGSLAMASPAFATLTPIQSQNFNFATLTANTNLAFNGFNAGLGTLTEVIVTFSANITLHNTAAVVPFGSGNQSVGTPNPLTATATLTASIPAFFMLATNSLTTPGFVGTVLDNNIVQTVGTANNPALTATSNITNPLLLPNYIGGSNLYSINMAASGTQGGSVPGVVLTGNTGDANGTVTVQYRYNEFATPEPASMAILGAGLAGIGLIRRRRRG